MMELVRENAENKKRLALSLICVAVTVIAVCALIALAASSNAARGCADCTDRPGSDNGRAGVGAAAVLDARAGYYQCPHCKATFTPALGEYVKAYTPLPARRLVCPACGKTGLCRRHIVR